MQGRCNRLPVRLSSLVLTPVWQGPVDEVNVVVDERRPLYADYSYGNFQEALSFLEVCRLVQSRNQV